MYKFARPFQEPQEWKKVGHSRAKYLQVALNRVKKCPKELVSEGNCDGTELESPVATLEQRDDQGSIGSTEELDLCIYPN